MRNCKEMFCFSSCLALFSNWWIWASVDWGWRKGTQTHECVFVPLHNQAKCVVCFISHFRDMLSSGAHQFIVAVKPAFLWGVPLLWRLLAYIISHPKYLCCLKYWVLVNAYMCSCVMWADRGFYLLHHSVDAIIKPFISVGFPPPLSWYWFYHQHLYFIIRVLVLCTIQNDFKLTFTHRKNPPQGLRLWMWDQKHV